MKWIIAVVAFLWSGIAVAGTAGIDRLGWMTGTWISRSGEAEVQESWTDGRGGLMLGTNRTVSTGKKTSFEFLRIVEEGGTLAYISSPGGGPTTTFKAVEVSGNRVVFENLQHDFPQRIIYWKKGKSSLCARIEGAVKGKIEGEEWCWNRAK